MKLLTLVGLALTLAGALVLVLRDLQMRHTPVGVTGENIERGVRLSFAAPPRWEAWVGFPLIALGTLLQLVAVALD